MNSAVIWQKQQEGINMRCEERDKRASPPDIRSWSHEGEAPHLSGVLLARYMELKDKEGRHQQRTD